MNRSQKFLGIGLIVVLALTAQTESDSIQKPVQHVVLVWLHKSGNTDIRQKLMETSKSFKQIPGVIEVSTGSAIISDRPVVDDSFDVAVIITFENRNAMQRYETHPIHTKAVEDVLRPVTERMIVYDFQEQ